MPALPFIAKGIVVVGGLLGAGWALDKADDAAGSAAKLAKWGAVAGGVYLAYKTSKTMGLIK